MATYKCTKYFNSTTHQSFAFDCRISSDVYNSLPYTEQQNFILTMDEDSSRASLNPVWDPTAIVIAQTAPPEPVYDDSDFEDSRDDWDDDDDIDLDEWDEMEKD